MKVIAAYRKADTTKALVCAFFVPNEISVTDTIDTVNNDAACELGLQSVDCVSTNNKLKIWSANVASSQEFDVWVLYNAKAVKCLRVNTKSGVNVLSVKTGLTFADIPLYPVPPSGNDAPMALQRANTVVNLGRL